MRVEKYQAVAQIVSALISKRGFVEQGAGARPNPQAQAEGFSVRLKEGKILLLDAEGGKITLEELIQYVDRYLG